MLEMTYATSCVHTQTEVVNWQAPTMHSQSVKETWPSNARRKKRRSARPDRARPPRQRLRSRRPHRRIPLPDGPCAGSPWFSDSLRPFPADRIDGLTSCPAARRYRRSAGDRNETHVLGPCAGKRPGAECRHFGAGAGAGQSGPGTDAGERRPAARGEQATGLRLLARGVRRTATWSLPTSTWRSRTSSTTPTYPRAAPASSCSSRNSPSRRPIEARMRAPVVAIVAEGDYVVLSFVREIADPKDPAKKYTTHVVRHVPDPGRQDRGALGSGAAAIGLPTRRVAHRARTARTRQRRRRLPGHASPRYRSRGPGRA